MALKDRFGSMGLFAVRDNNEIINLAEHFLELNSDAGAILTTTPLGGGASYTQAGQDRLNRSPVVNRVKGEVWADQAGTLYLEESENNSTWTATRTVAVSAGVTAQIPWTILTKRYFRFRYVNGATAQTGFILVQQTGGPGMRNAQLTGRKIQLPAHSDYSQVLNLAPNNDITITITPPVGVIWRLRWLWIRIDAPTGATSGTHLLAVRSSYNDVYNEHLYLDGAYNLRLEIRNNVIDSATTKKPNDIGSQQRAILNMVASNVAPLYVWYKNLTDVTQTETLFVKMLKEEEYIV